MRYPCIKSDCINYNKCVVEQKYNMMNVCMSGGYKLFESIELQNLPEADAYSLLAEVRAVLDEIIKGELILYFNTSITKNDYWTNKLYELQKKVSEHFS